MTNKRKPKKNGDLQPKDLPKARSRRRIEPPAKDARPDKEKKMRRTRFDLIANQMMRGGFAPHHTRNKVATDEEITAFKEVHGDTIRWVEENMPRYINGGVMGAVGKAVLWYGREKMLPFMEQLRTCNFHGRYDPAHVLYLWLNKNASKNTRDSYRRAITAIRAHIAGKKMMRLRNGEPEVEGFVPAGTDIFEWDRTYTIMHPPKHIGPRIRPRSTLDEQSAEELQLAQEVEEALHSLASEG